MRGATFLLAAVLLAPLAAPAGAPVPVRHAEVDARQPLVLLAPDGSRLTEGELRQSVEGMRVTTRVVFRFPDGSLHDETVVFSQDGSFRFIRDRLVQSGPAFPRAIDMTIDGGSGRVSVTSSDKGGPSRRMESVLDLPADLANGMVPTLLKNLGPGAPRRRLPLVVATPSPRLVRLEVASAAAERMPAGQAGTGTLVTHYVLKVRIGGAAGFFAPLVRRRPPDSHVWIADADPPAYLRSDQPFYVGGPLWRIDAGAAQ